MKYRKTRFAVGGAVISLCVQSVIFYASGAGFERSSAAAMVVFFSFVMTVCGVVFGLVAETEGKTKQ